MTQHSLLRAKGLLTANSEIYYNFDVDDFTTNLNGMTRFLVYLGTAAIMDKNQEQDPITLHYVHMKDEESSFLHSQSSSGKIFVSQKSFSASSETVTLVKGQPSEKRFIEKTSISPRIGLTSEKICVHYIDAIGGMWPTPQRGNWFPKTGDIGKHI